MRHRIGTIGLSLGMLWMLSWDAGCSSRKEGECERDSHCQGAQVCFEGHCISMKDLEQLKKEREAAAKPKVCEDKDGDGVRAGDGCPDTEPKDCNDADVNMAPGRPEVCDAVDNDCDGMVNEGQKGCVQTLFGGATWGNQAEHRLENPRSVVYDPAGFVLVTDNHHVWKVSLDGKAEVLAGSHLSNFADGAGEQARFSYPEGLAPAPGGSVAVADCKNNCIRTVSSGGQAGTLAGFCSNLTKYVGQYADGSSSDARFYCPSDMALAPDGSWIVVDRDNARIRRIASTGQVTTIAGAGPMEIREGEGQDGFKDGPGNEARFNDPQSVVVDSSGTIYVSESYNCRVRKIVVKSDGTSMVSTLAGESDTMLGVGGYQDGTGKGAKFGYPHGMFLRQDGQILIADTGNAVIRLMSRAGQVRTLYGKAKEDKYVDGPIPQARFMTPMDVAEGPDGSLFVADTAANRLRWIVP